MSEISSKKQSLKAQISEMETSLAGLKSQLRTENENEQHAAIDKLEEYLGDLDNKYAGLQALWKVLRDEMEKLVSGRSDDREVHKGGR